MTRSRRKWIKGSSRGCCSVRRNTCPGFGRLSTVRTWTGFHAATPDKLPLIGPRSGDESLFLATGHEGLGMTTALATGRILVDQITARSPRFPLRLTSLRGPHGSRRMPSGLAVTVNGVAVDVAPGSTVAVATVLAGQACRTSVSGQRRGPLCGVGVCFECRVTINGIPHCRSCQILCEPGMEGFPRCGRPFRGKNQGGPGILPGLFPRAAKRTMDARHLTCIWHPSRVCWLPEPEHHGPVR